MGNAWLIAKEDLRYALRQKVTLLWVFVMPPIFFAFIGSTTGGSPVSSLERPTVLVLEAPDESGFLTDALEAHLRRFHFEVTRIEPGEVPHPDSASPLRLVLPSSFTSDLVAGQPVHLQLHELPSGPAGDLATFRIRRAAWSSVADMLVLRLQSEELPSAEAMAQLHAIPRSIEIESRPAGERLEIPSGYAQAVPGNLVMFTLLVMLTSGAGNLLAERRLGLLLRLASAPVSRSEVIAGKWLGRLGLGWVQIGFAMIAGTLLFDLDWGPDLFWVVLVLAAWGAFCAAAGLLLGAVARSHGQVVGLGLMTTMTLAALGGCWWPIEVAPDWMQSIAKILPSGWTMDAIHRLVSFQSGPSSAWPHLLLLVVATFFLASIAARNLRFDRQ